MTCWSILSHSTLPGPLEAKSKCCGLIAVLCHNIIVFTIHDVPKTRVIIGDLEYISTNTKKPPSQCIQLLPVLVGWLETGSRTHTIWYGYDSLVGNYITNQTGVHALAQYYDGCTALPHAPNRHFLFCSF